MRVSVKMIRKLLHLVLFSVILAVGCERESQTAADVYEDSGKSSGLSAQQSEELNRQIQSIRVNLLTQPAVARQDGIDLRLWIASLDKGAACEYAINEMEKGILSVDTRSLRKADRERTISAIFDLEMEVVNALGVTRATRVRLWTTRVRALRRLRREVELSVEESRQPGMEEQKRRGLQLYGQFVDANYQMQAEIFEYDWVVRESPRANDDERRQITLALADVLGRPLRTRQQIFGAYERNRPKNQTDGDVKVDLGL